MSNLKIQKRLKNNVILRFRIEKPLKSHLMIILKKLTQ